MERFEIIKEKLKELRNLDKRYSIFGSSRHRYQLNDTLTEKEIGQIETENKIVLSDDYKAILKHLGNGDAGCGYGLEKISLKNINPPYIGTAKLLRNWEDPENVDYDMVELDEISGYIKLFDYGCGMEYCLIVNGEEEGDLIFFDCDGRFEKMENKTLLQTYEYWLDSSLNTLRRVHKKLEELTLQEVIDSEWELKNFSINEMVLSILNAEPPRERGSAADLKSFMEIEHQKWVENKN